MAARPPLSFVGPPAVWLPAPQPLPRSARPSTFLQAEETRSRGGPAALFASAQLTDRRSVGSQQIKSASAPGRECITAANSVDDALAAARARRRCHCRSMATAVRERPSAQAGASAPLQQLAQYPWPVDPQWLAATVGSNAGSSPGRPSGAARRGVPPQLTADRPASGAVRASRQPSAPAAAANGQVSPQPSLTRSAVRTQTEAERLAQTVR